MKSMHDAPRDGAEVRLIDYLDRPVYGVWYPPDEPAHVGVWLLSRETGWRKDGEFKGWEPCTG